MYNRDILRYLLTGSAENHGKLIMILTETAIEQLPNTSFSLPATTIFFVSRTEHVE
jgi:hypothetical protein